jgi:hypothetical protein
MVERIDAYIINGDLIGRRKGRNREFGGSEIHWLKSDYLFVSF